MSEKLEALLQAVIDAETDTSYHYASESLAEAAPQILALIKARTPAPEGEASWIEPALVDHLRFLGCVCPKPLVGYRPNAGPRCRLCNVEPASPVVPAPEGEAWRTVPVEPTEAMLVNGREALMPTYRLLTCGPLIGVWKDMLAASPVVPVGVSREDEAWSLAMGIPAFNDLPAQFQQDIYDAIIAALRPTDTGREA
jgi:hypothetical protein